MLTFNSSPFDHFVQAVNEIWYPGRAIIMCLRYSMLLSYCIQNGGVSKVMCLIQIILWGNEN